MVERKNELRVCLLACLQSLPILIYDVFVSCIFDPDDIKDGHRESRAHIVTS